MYKYSYFQGTEEPTPKKKQYKSDPALIVQPRFKEPLYRNYDLYGGESGPGVGWHSMQDFKSIQDFLKARRKKLKDKYKADDSWILDDGTITKTKQAIRKNLLKVAEKDINSIDFSIDQQIQPDPIIGNQGAYLDNIPFGGMSDYLALPDSDDKTNEHLNFERNLEKDQYPTLKLINKYLNLLYSDFLGLPDGMQEREDFPSPNNPEYGETNSGTLMYDNTWF